MERKERYACLLSGNYQIHNLTFDKLEKEGWKKFNVTSSIR
jgi:hypothetical protein